MGQLDAPVLWGGEAVVQERLGYGISDFTMTRRMHTFTYPFSPAEVVEFFRLIARSFRLMKMRPQSCGPNWRRCGHRKIWEAMSLQLCRRSISR
jgi:hypothetical protein